MKPTNVIELICCAIATEEGYFGAGTTPRLRNNPGDLRYAKQANASAPGWNGVGIAPVATFTTSQAGIVGLFRDVLAKVATGVTLRQLIYEFAPPNENNSALYVKNVLDWTGLPADVPVLTLIPDLYQMNLPVTNQIT